MPNLIKCAIPPVRDGYTVTVGNQVVSTQLEGGASRYRADLLGAVSYVTIQWIVEGKDFDYLMAFWRTGTQYGALPFLIDLLFESQTPQEYTAYFVAGDNKTASSNQGFQVSKQEGLSYVISATLEVMPNPQDINNDMLLLSRN